MPNRILKINCFKSRIEKPFRKETFVQRGVVTSRYKRYRPAIAAGFNRINEGLVTRYKKELITIHAFTTLPVSENVLPWRFYR